MYCRTEASCHTAAKPTKACLSASSCKCATPPYPQRCPSDMGSRKQVQAENANALHKNSSDSETERLQDIQEEPHRCIGPSCVKELAKLFTQHQTRRTTAMSTPGQDARSSLSQKRRREGVMKRNNCVI